MAALVMIRGIGSSTVITAVMTSSSSTTCRSASRTASHVVSAKLDQISVRLEVIETALKDSGGRDRDE